MDTLSDTISDLLRSARVDGNVLLPYTEQMDRKTYKALDHVLQRLGGKWKSGVGHIFTYNPESHIKAVLATGELPPHNPYAFFDTPQKVIPEWLWPIKWQEFGSAEFGNNQWDYEHKRILEPSAGTGSLAAFLQERCPRAQLDLVEIDPLNAYVLERKGFNVTKADFLEWQPVAPYDLIVMNPPFNVKGDSMAFITHVMHAWDMLKERGHLFFICPDLSMPKNNRRWREFRQFVTLYNDGADSIAPFTNAEFRESGTTFSTWGVHLEKDDWRKKRRNGYLDATVEGFLQWLYCSGDTYNKILDIRHDMAEGEYNTTYELLGETMTTNDIDIPRVRQEMRRIVERVEKILADPKSIDHEDFGFDFMALNEPQTEAIIDHMMNIT